MVNKYLKPFLEVFSTNFLVKLVGFFKELLFGWIYGPNVILDTYFFITSIPNMINATWNKALETVLLSAYQKLRIEKGDNEANHFLSSSVVILSIFTILIYLILFLIINLVLKQFFGDYFDYEKIDAAKIVSFAIIFETLILSVKVNNYANKRFVIPTLLPIFQSGIIVLALVFLTDSLNIIHLSILYSCGAFLQLTVLLKYPWFWKFIKKINLTYFNTIKDFLKNTFLLTVASGISFLNIFVDQAFALRISEGAVTYIHYGAFFLTLFQIFFVQNIYTIFFPQFQEYYLNEDYDSLTSDTQNIIKLIFIICLLIQIILINNGFYVINLILGHGKMSSTDIQLIYKIVLAYGLAFLGTALNAVLIRLLHIYQRFKFIFVMSLVNFTLNIVFNIYFIHLFGIVGIALSTSLTFIIM